MEQRFISCLAATGFHRLAYTLTPGPTGGPVTICVHGLTRNGRDFDPLAEALSQRGSVLAPDMPGRGKSDWLGSAVDYNYPQYLADVAALIAASGASSVNFIGTSMGGIIGMMLASLTKSPIARLVLNDVGALIPKASLERIGTYVGKAPSFKTLVALEQYFRLIHAPFGQLTDAQWHHMAEHGNRVLPNGEFGLAYDPAIGQAFAGPMSDVDLWGFYDRITCPTLLIRGAESDLLPRNVAVEMTQRGPRAQLYEVAHAGHAPALMADDQISVIDKFLATQGADAPQPSDPVLLPMG